MSEIRIDNLTHHQVDLLDEMWACETEDEYMNWYFSLSEEDQSEADILMRVVAMELAEDYIKDCGDAKVVLSKFTLKGL
jgi:hypothetical protein